MKPDLVGYILNALQPGEQAEAEAYLREHPQAVEEVQALRRGMAPLDLDAWEAVPPGLAERTMRHIAANAAPKSVTSVPRRAIPFGGMSWRRMAQAAAAVLVCATALGLGITWIGNLQTGGTNTVQVVACKDNLRKVFTSLVAYGDTHGGEFPKVTPAPKPQANVSETMFAMLRDSGVLAADSMVGCPTSYGPAGARFDYAYSLGYMQNGQLVGPRIEDAKPISSMPLMADGSPRDPGRSSQSNSHGGSGQNVLYQDGHVTFCLSRNVGVNGDDIYLNRAKKVSPGLDWNDAVLTSGQYPP